MRAIRRCDRYEVDSIGAFPLGFEHFSPSAVSALPRHTETDRIGVCAHRVDVHSGGAELEHVVHVCGDSVRCADLAALAAADQPPLQPHMRYPAAVSVSGATADL